ncbi:MAG TPA: zinc-dependent alcohol dehydrogenase family protein [Solirubrobacteraceae bacterium]|nr:zinc-dependent alcohol dehydrogenase family protein [Solirubrobacteraceae bacterium]
MRAAVLHAFGEPLAVEDVPDPAPADDGAVVAVRATGVCRSDWHAWQGHDASVVLPHVGGHELAGEVVAVGPQVRSVQVGDRVTVPFCCGCGVCEPCTRGETQVCERDLQPGFTLWGSFAELVALPCADLNLVRLPEGLGFVAAAALGCRFMTAWAALRVHGRVAEGEWVAVHGCGGVGLSAVMIAVAAGARVVAVDIDPAKLDRARELGAAAVADASREDAAAAVESLTGGGAHVAVDALGSPETLAASVLGLRRHGRHLQVGLLLAGDERPPVPMARVISRELTLHGVHGMAVRHYPGLLDAVASGALDPAALVGRTLALDDVGAELAAMGGFATRGLSVVDRL